MNAVLPSFLMLMLTAGPLGAQTPEIQRDLDSVLCYLREHKAAGGDLQGKSDSALAKVFPDIKFFVVRYRQFPVARLIPEGFKASNVLVLAKDGTVQRLNDRAALETLFRDLAPETRTAGSLTDLLSAWLTLAQEQYQDGFYKFEILTKDFTVTKERTQIRGRAVVMQGGNGELSATLELRDGKLAKAMERANIKPGPRPIGTGQ